MPGALPPSQPAFGVLVGLGVRSDAYGFASRVGDVPVPLAAMFDGPASGHEVRLRQGLFQIPDGDGRIEGRIWRFPLGVEPVDIELAPRHEAVELDFDVGSVADDSLDAGGYSPTLAWMSSKRRANASYASCSAVFA